MKKLTLAILLATIVAVASAQNPTKEEYRHSPVAGTEWNAAVNQNPFIPGYFADPTIRKFGDIYYLYATTDGTGNGYGPAQVWVSKDFVNWRNFVCSSATAYIISPIPLAVAIQTHIVCSMPHLLMVLWDLSHIEVRYSLPTRMRWFMVQAIILYLILMTTITVYIIAIRALRPFMVSTARYVSTV